MTSAMLSRRSKSVPPTWTPDVLRMSLAPVGCARRVRGQAQHGKVRRAAADIDHQRQRFLVERALEMERGRDRLELEFDMRKPLRPRGGLELILARAVGRVVAVDEEDRAPEHDMVRHWPPCCPSSRSRRWRRKRPISPWNVMRSRPTCVVSFIRLVPRIDFSARMKRPSAPSMYSMTAARPKWTLPSSRLKNSAEGIVT